MCSLIWGTSFIPKSAESGMPVCLGHWTSWSSVFTLNSKHDVVTCRPTIHAPAHTCTHLHTHMHSPTHKHTRMWTHHGHIQAHIHTDTHTGTYMPACIHAYTCTYTHSYAHTNVHWDRRINLKHIHTTRMYTYIWSKCVIKILASKSFYVLFS